VSFIFPGGAAVLIGYVRVSKSDGTQTLLPQRDVSAALQKYAAEAAG